MIKINGVETDRFIATKSWLILFEVPLKGDEIQYQGKVFIGDGIRKDYVLRDHSQTEIKGYLNGMSH